MTDRTALHERWEKVDAEFTKACRDVNESHDVWAAACDRLQRLTRERAEAFQALVASNIQ